MNIRIPLFLLMLTLITLCAHGKALNTDRSKWVKGQYKHYSTMPSQRLLSLGEDFLYNKQMSDSAFLCYTIVAERYRPGMSEKDIATCLEGYYGRWMTRSIYYSDIPSAIQDLSAAQEIIELTSLPTNKLDLFYGQSILCIYASNNFKLFDEYNTIMEAFRRSTEASLKLRDWPTFHNAFINLVKVASYKGSNEILAPFVKVLPSIPDPDKTRKKISILYYKASKSLIDYKHEEGIALYDSLIAYMPDNLRYVRLKTQCFLQKYALLNEINRSQECVAVTDSLLKLSYRFRFPDIRTYVWELCSQSAAALGDTAKARDYHIRYLELKDSLAGEQQLVDFQDIAISRQRRAMQRDIDAAEYSSRMRGNTLIFTCVIAVLLLAFVVYLIRSNRRIRRRSEMLYHQLQSTINSPEWIDAKPAVLTEDSEKTEASLPTTTDETPEPEEDSGEADNASDYKSAEKYAGSGLSQDIASELVSRIKHFILTSEKIYSPDFSMSALVAELDTNRQYLSQCINQHFGCNFSTLVNRARIRRAMLMLDDEKAYGHYSIEGIAESVGFRTRNAFTTWFRRFTGLSAAEYRRLGKTLRPKL